MTYKRKDCSMKGEILSGLACVAIVVIFVAWFVFVLTN